MEFKAIYVIALLVVVLLVVFLLALANQAPSTSSVQPQPPYGLSAVQAPGGFILTWNSGRNATAYNLYIFDNLNSVVDQAVQSIQNVQSPYFLQDRYLNANGDTYLGLTSVRNYANGELESGLCKVYLLPQGETSLTPPILNCQGAYNFDGQFEASAETCFQQASDDRIFMRWFPVTGATGYRVYYYEGTINTSSQMVSLSQNAYSYLSPPLAPSSCWSFYVTAMDARGRESAPSQIFTTCVI